MYKLVVLFALVAVAVAAPKPGLLAAPLAYAAPAVAIPTAVSHQSRVDVRSSPVIATYAAPAVAAYAAAPAISYAAPAISYAAPAISYAHHAAPLISSYSGIHGGLIY